MDRNLLKETIEELGVNNKTPKDVVGITDGEVTCDWDTFAEHADFTYDAGFGGEEINLNLMVVGKDFWLERHEYYGSEWWEYKSQPTLPKPGLPVLESE